MSRVWPGMSTTRTVAVHSSSISTFLLNQTLKSTVLYELRRLATAVTLSVYKYSTRTCTVQYEKYQDPRSLDWLHLLDCPTFCNEP